MIVSVSAGGSPDIIGRLIAQWLSDQLGQPFVVDNRAGAAGNIGTEFVLKAAPDGYTLLLALSANAINASLYKDLQFNFIRDAAPIASIATIPSSWRSTLSVRKTISGVHRLCQNQSGKMHGIGGVESPLHVAGELFKMMAGVHLVHVPYRSEALALPDLLAGQVQVFVWRHARVARLCQSR